jgi:hypothetical protein
MAQDKALPQVGAEVRGRETALARLREGIEKMRFCSDGKLPSRDELHERT